jgi:ubiquinone/menaquinone biosynthesis C-methylase UbiE
MSTTHRQAELWGTAPMDWATYLETTFIPVYKKILGKTNPGSGSRILDIGCGSGLFLRMAASTGATLTGIDVSSELLAIARQRNPGSELLNSDMEQLSFPEDYFDLATGFNSLPYANNPLQLFRKIYGVLKPGGKLAIAVWSSEAHCESLNVLASIASLLPEPPPGSPGPLALSEPGKAAHLLTGAGFEITDKGTIECHWNFSSLEEAVKGILSAGPSVEAIRYAGIDKVKERLLQSLETFLIHDELYVLENVFQYFIATKI